MDENWHAASIEETARRLATDPKQGLAVEEAALRLAADGPNELRRGSEISPLTIFAQQFRSLVIWVLIAAGVVAKEASDMVITDDNFASIVAAVEEGRGIFDNIAKTLAYLLAGNAGELALVLVATLAGYPLPLLPIQLLWIDLVTDGLPALALATDPIDPGVLDRPPRRPDAQLAGRSMLAGIALTGCLTAAVAFGVFAHEMGSHGELATARNAAFSTLVFAELLRAFGARSETKLVHEIGLFSNLRLFAIVAVSFGLQIWIHHAAALERLFGVQPISLRQCLAWIAIGSLPLLVLEIRKWLRRTGARAGGPTSSPRLQPSRATP